MIESENTTTAMQTPEFPPKPVSTRELDRTRRALKHGETGEPPSSIDPVEACKRGICLAGGGTWPYLAKHVSGCKFLPPGSTWASYLDRFKIPPGLAVARIDVQQGHTVSTETRRKLTEVNLGSTRADTQLWPTMRLLTSGIGQKEAAEKLGEKNYKTVQHRAQAVGYSFGAPSICDHGEPFRHIDLIYLRQLSGFPADEFEERFGLPKWRSAASRTSNSITDPGIAKKAMAERDRIIKALLEKAENKSYRKDEILKTWLPKLAVVNASLIATIGQVRLALRANLTCGEFVCRQAKLEHVGKLNGDAWQRSMMYLWQIEPWIAKNLDRLRNEAGDDGPLVREMIGSAYGASEKLVQSALRGRREGIDRDKMRDLILRFAESKGGRPSRRDEIKQQCRDARPLMQRFIDTRNALSRWIRKSEERTVAAMKNAGFSEAEIAAGRSAKSAKNAARHLVTNATGLSYDTVVEYDQD